MSARNSRTQLPFDALHRDLRIVYNVLTNPPEAPLSKTQVILLTLLATLSVSAGEALLSIGMKQVAKGGAEGFKYVLAAATNPRVLIGTALMAAFFAIYAHTLSGADFSFVLPLTAMSFLFGALLAHFYLNEHVSLTRWVGTLIIMLGVGVVVFGEKQPAGKQAAAPVSLVETVAEAQSASDS